MSLRVVYSAELSCGSVVLYRVMLCGEVYQCSEHRKACLSREACFEYDDTSYSSVPLKPASAMR